MKVGLVSHILEKLELPIAIKEFFPPKIASRDTTTGNNTIYVFDGAEEKSFEDGMRRSVKEARSMSKLEAYEGIVSIRDFFNENKTAYIIMEYVDGDTLKILGTKWKDVTGRCIKSDETNYEGIGADAPDRINSSRCQSG